MSKSATKEMPIYENDVVETGKKSRICVMFVDNTWFILGQEAKLSIDEYVFDPENAKNNKGRFSAIKGAFEYASGLLDKYKNPDVKIQTGFGSVGIRGTQVLAGDDYGPFGIFDQSGNIDVGNNGGNADLGPGQGTDLTGNDQPPGPPQHWSKKKIKHLHSQIDFHDQGALDKLIDKLKHHHHEHGPHHADNAPPPSEDHADDARDGSDNDFFDTGPDLNDPDFGIIRGGGGGT